MSLAFSNDWIIGAGGISADYRGFAGCVVSYDGYVPNTTSATNNIQNLAIAGNSITFFKGALPTLTEMNTFLVSSRSSDMLLQFSSSALSITKVTGTKTIKISFDSNLGTVAQDGTMTWFNIGNTSATISNRCQFFGTVGLAGSGADLILPKIDVVSSDLWLCSNLYFDFSNYNETV